jgi:DNA-binding response OmpR family regulator
VWPAGIGAARSLAIELHKRQPSAMGRDDINVLLVEDEKLLNWSLASALSRWGFAVRAVFTGNDAVAHVEKSRFDVALLDYRLPDVDGLAVARLIRARQPRVSIFLMTSFQLSELSPDAGLIDNCFSKPLDLQQLHRALADIRGKVQEAAQAQGIDTA